MDVGEWGNLLLISAQLTDPTVHQSDIWCLTTAAPTFLPILDGGKAMEQYTTALLFAFMPYLRPNPGSLE